MWSTYDLTPWHSPFSQLQAMQRDMNALFSRFFGEGEQHGDSWWSSTEGYAPHMESWVKDNALHFKADLPGMEPHDVEITVEGNRLTLRGERKAEHENKDGQYFHREVRYGSFERSFTIPEGTKAEEVQASYRNGVLELTVPLPAALLPKKVPIAVESQPNGQPQIDAPK
jgi:HSP20 family protein